MRNFSPSSNKKDIFVYKRDEKPFRSGIINLTASNDFYSVRDEKTGEKDQTIEKFFSQLESAAKPIIDKIIFDKQINLNDDERIALTQFLGFLYVRNQTFRQKTKNFYSEIMKQTLAFTAHNREHFRQSLKSATIDEITEEQAEGARKLALSGNYDIDYKEDDHFIGATLSMAKDIMPIFWGKNWRIITTTTSRSFVTSDNPISIAPPRNHVKHPFGGLGLLEADIYLPLSPDTVLFYTNSKEWPEVIKLKREWVDSTNKLTAQFARSFYLSILNQKI